MRILFLCGSLEEGRDGVGDYARCLAAELKLQGHEVALLALNDPYIEQESEVIQSAKDVELTVLRLPANWPAGERFARAKAWIAGYDPEWLSLQLVLYSFHPKGLPLGLASQLQTLGEGRKWHIMFHELWIGMSTEASIRAVWIGRLQKLIIRSIFAKLRDAVVHTQTTLYQIELARLGVKAHYLPLFANIPVIVRPPTASRDTLAAEKELRFVVFGTLHPGAPVQIFAQELAAYVEKNKLAVSLKLVGRNGAEQTTWVRNWDSLGLHPEVLGEKSPKDISQLLSDSSIGLTTTPVALTEKSGTVAAMCEHQLPVISVSNSFQPKNAKDLAVPAGIMAYSVGNLAALLNNRRLTVADTYTAQRTASKLAHDISEA